MYLFAGSYISLKYNQVCNGVNITAQGTAALDLTCYTKKNGTVCDSSVRDVQVPITKDLKKVTDPKGESR
ncbi:MAG: hypothetical protein Q9191_006155, partial [Dirinaria sp. TL-2023a]